MLFIRNIFQILVLFSFFGNFKFLYFNFASVMSYIKFFQFSALCVSLLIRFRTCSFVVTEVSCLAKSTSTSSALSCEFLLRGLIIDVQDV